MAQATRTPAVTRTEVVEVQPGGITLKLSMEEAGALLAVARRIGGAAATTRRRHFDAINIALCEAGVTDQHDNDFDPKLRAIYFTETPV